MVFLLPAALTAQVFIDVNGGGMTYTMISDGEENFHDIWVDDFRMADTEVTVGQWRVFTEDTGLDFPWEGHYCGDISELSPGENCPIQLVRIDEAAAYCNWRSLKEGLDPVYYQIEHRILRDPEADGYRLPETKEWDFAARGGRLSRGYVYAGSDVPQDVAWFNRPVGEGTHPVGTKKPNELGFFDMSGNIREWTWPEVGIPYPVNVSEERLSLRGGSWTSPSEKIRLDFHSPARVFQWASIGFRLARNAE